MAHDEAYAQILREALDGIAGISEKKMFGGICFMLNGNMLCGTLKDGAMFRVGKEHEQTALEIDGAIPLGFTGRKMGGLIEVDAGALDDVEKRSQWLKLAQDFVGAMPPK